MSWTRSWEQVSGHCQVREGQDLIIQSDDITFSENPVQWGDTVTVLARVRNVGGLPAPGVPVEIQDVTSGELLCVTSVDIGAGEAATISAPWVTGGEDVHTIEVRVGIDVVEESDYSNNRASRDVLFGATLDAATSPVAARRLAFHSPRPNPTSGATAFEIEVPQAAPASLQVFDLSGRRVKNWRWEVLATGTHVINWSGRGLGGARLSPGVYLCRLEVGGVRMYRKVVIRP